MDVSHQHAVGISVVILAIIAVAPVIAHLCLHHREGGTTAQLAEISWLMNEDCCSIQFAYRFGR